VRTASLADADPVCATLSRAFFDDPMLCYVLPNEATRAAKMPGVFRVLFKLAAPLGACHVTSGYEAATLWRPPGKWHIPLWQYVTNGPALLSLFGTDTLRVLGAMDTMEKVHPKEPHWYLQTIGTDPAKQGKGFGSLIMRHQLAAADAQGLPCYLESSKTSNIAIYQTFGFELTGEIKLPNGPTLYPMWRKVRAA
jgi:ribosomal protein S18 acetylase RimI-like enzyme